jgi:hypothetical protein
MVETGKGGVGQETGEREGGVQSQIPLHERGDDGLGAAGEAEMVWVVESVKAALVSEDGEW